MQALVIGFSSKSVQTGIFYTYTFDTTTISDKFNTLYIDYGDDTLEAIHVAGTIYSFYYI
jgi:hypothetical protein